MTREFKCLGAKRTDADGLLRAALDASPHAIMLERAGTVTYANSAGAQMLGFQTGAEVIGRSIAELGAGSPDPDSERREYPFNWKGAPVAVHTTRNVSERRQLERRLAAAEKMELLGRLVGGVAHDFNNLLTAIGLYTDLLAQAVPSCGPAQRYAEEIRKAGERGGGLIAQLLAFARHETTEPRPVSLNAVLAGMRDLLQRLLGPGITLEMHRGEPLGPVKADPAQIEQVVLNLAMNARDAMREGGRLTITTSAVRMRTQDLRQWRGTGAQLRPGNHVKIEVRDTGCGMDGEISRHALELFFTTKQGRGTGLGLPTVHAILMQSGGALSIESAVGRGTTVTILLPVAAARRADVNARRRTRGDLPRGSETVLLAEPDDAVRSAMEQVLADCGYKVLIAQDGAKATRMARRHRNIELLITDVVLPGESGEKLAQRFAQVNSGVPILYVSAYARLRRAVAPANGAILLKPFRKAALAQRVRQALDKIQN